ncbi:hypothetical protein ACIOMM_31720 [Streptomyces sp. NPDC087908]|uniref:hypothetical protein n=1 Tax=Streptomyces sp. NPDC087908 TaxID=3365820 RepID=UPI00380207F6
MSYVVTVEACLPDDADELDALQQVGASALLEHGFDAVEGIEGPDGIEVDILEALVAVHPRGAVVKVFVHAPTLETAEDAVGSVAAEVLERSELLADWLVESSEVKLPLDLTRESLEAADGPDAPPSDLRVRRARHTAGADPAGTAPSVGLAGAPGTDAATGTDEDDEDRDRADLDAQLRALAPRLASFGAHSFGAPGPVERETRAEEPSGGGGRTDGGRPAGFGSPAAELAAGALVYASEVLIDELYDDVRTLADEETTVAECRAELWHLSRLPSRFGLAYDELFARRLLVTAIALTTRFTDGSFRRLGCLAEELALNLLLQQARSTLDLYGLLGEEVAASLDRFAHEVSEDMDLAWLYDDEGDGAEPREAGTPEDGAGPEDGTAGHPAAPGVTAWTIGTWFTPFDAERYVHPYAVDEEAGRPSTHD